MIDSELELVDTLTCDELCLMSNKHKIKDVVEDHIMANGCSCGLNNQEIF
jgi:hypothetical protein